MAEMYLDPQYAPEAVAERCGISAPRIRASRPNLPASPSTRRSSSTMRGPISAASTTQTMTGRPVSFHAMRGISAHANGFQTCRALHVLQIILGTVEVPGGFRFKPPYPKPATAHPKPHCKRHAGRAARRPASGLCARPR